MKYSKSNLVMFFLLMVFGLAAIIAVINKPPVQPATTVPLQSQVASLGQKLLFPKGYHLVSTYAYAQMTHDPIIVYICQSDIDVMDYRVCTPETK